MLAVTATYFFDVTNTTRADQLGRNWVARFTGRPLAWYVVLIVPDCTTETMGYGKFWRIVWYRIPDDTQCIFTIRPWLNFFRVAMSDMVHYQAARSERRSPLGAFFPCPRG